MSDKKSWIPASRPDSGGGGLSVDVTLSGDIVDQVNAKQGHDFRSTGFWILLALLIVLSIVLFTLIGYVIYYRRQARLEASAARDSSLANASKVSESTLQERIEMRYKTVETWMISKKVLPHDEFCSSCIHVLAEKNEGGSTRSHASTDDASALDRTGLDLEAPNAQSASVCSLECPICFEAFKPGQVVSFSAIPQCNHIFHHHCIKEWLLRHTNCPFCRTMCMHADAVRGKPDALDFLEEYVRLHRQRSATTICCSQNGLLSIPPQVHCTSEELKQLKARLASSVVSYESLAEQRKTRQHVKASLKQSGTAADESSSHSGDEPGSAPQGSPSRSSIGSQQNDAPLPLNDGAIIDGLEEDFNLMDDEESNASGTYMPQDILDTQDPSTLLMVKSDQILVHDFSSQCSIPQRIEN